MRPTTNLPEVLLEDGPLIAVHKPAGWLTQGEPTDSTALDAWIRDYLRAKYHKPGNIYLGVPHQLDRPVSGVVVFARNSKAAARLAEQFRNREVEKVYWALVEGRVEPSEGEWIDWVVKDSAASRVDAVSPEEPGARECRLRYRVLETDGARTLLELQPLTGRTHQLRVQLARRGWPIVGDRKYGSVSSWSDDSEHRIALHARRLTLKHPIRYDVIVVESPAPPEMCVRL